VTHARDVPRLYTAPVNLWVEDSISRHYLQELWRDSAVRSLIGGGKEGVLALIRDAEENGYETVFALVDCDFGKTNYKSWTDPKKAFRRFVLPVHELENYLLDERALAQCDLNIAKRPPSEIAKRMKARAREIVWWMACRKVIVQLRDAVLGHFMAHPKCPEVGDLAAAESYILGSVWYEQIPSRMRNIRGKGTVRTELREAHQHYSRDLVSGKWRKTFSGKEIFRAIRGYVYVPQGQGGAKSVLDADLGKSVAAKQVDIARQPRELVELLTSLRRKAGLP